MTRWSAFARRVMWIAPLCGLCVACDETKIYNLPSACPDGRAALPDLGRADRPRTDSKSALDVRPATDGKPATAGYGVELTAGHGHIYKTVALLFTIRDLGSCTDPKDPKTCKGVSGLPVVAFTRAAGAAAATEQALAPGKLVDNKDGTYTYTRVFGFFGAHVVGIKYPRDGQLVVAAFPYETAKGGGEKYFCDVNKDGQPDVSFQIRWNAGQEVLTADGTEVVFSVELQRSWNPPPIDTVTPFKNSFDYLTTKLLATGLPTVKLMADKAGAAKTLETLTPVYKGRGIYEVKRKFAAADLGGAAERTFWLSAAFTDDQACIVNGTDEEEYYFTVVQKN